MNYYRVRFTLANGKKVYVMVLAAYIEGARAVALEELERLPGTAVVNIHVTPLHAHTKAQYGRWATTQELERETNHG
jgi:hypothetical protein